MKHVILYLLILTFAAACRLNYTDKAYKKQGRWKVYYDDEKRKLISTGRYKNDLQRGSWHYYTASGQHYLYEKYNGKGEVKTTYYYSNGHKHLEGVAHLVSIGDTTYYRWEGEWKKFDSTGTLQQIMFYKMGKFAWNKPLR